MEEFVNLGARLTNECEEEKKIETRQMLEP